MSRPYDLDRYAECDVCGGVCLCRCEIISRLDLYRAAALAGLLANSKNLFPINHDNACALVRVEVDRIANAMMENAD